MEIQIICIFTLSVTMLCCYAQITEEVKARIWQQIDECKTTEGADDADVARFLAGESPSTLKGKCLISCMQEAFGLIKDGQVQPEGARKLGQMLFGNNDDVLTALEMIHAECAPLSDPDRCELAFIRMSCAKKVAEKHGLNPPHEMI